MTTSSWNKLLWEKTMKTSRSSKATMEIMEMLVVYHLQKVSGKYGWKK